MLDAAQRRVIAAGAADREHIACEVVIELRALLHVRLLEDPGLATAIDGFLADVGRQSRPATGITQHAEARDNARIYQAGGNIGNIGDQR